MIWSVAGASGYERIGAFIGAGLRCAGARGIGIRCGLLNKAKSGDETMVRAKFSRGLFFRADAHKFVPIYIYG